MCLFFFTPKKQEQNKKQKTKNKHTHIHALFQTTHTFSLFVILEKGVGAQTLLSTTHVLKMYLKKKTQHATTTPPFLAHM